MCQPQNGQNSEAVNLLYSLQHYFLYLGYIPPTFSSYRALQYLLFCRILWRFNRDPSSTAQVSTNSILHAQFCQPHLINNYCTSVSHPQNQTLVSYENEIIIMQMFMIAFIFYRICYIIPFGY